MSEQLQIIVADSGLDESKGKVILDTFKDYFALADEWAKKANDIQVTDESQDGDMALARTGRLFLREKRIAIEKTRKKLKEQALREGKAIDGIANVLKALIVPIEKHLEAQEKFVEFKAKKEEEQKRIEAEKVAEQERLRVEQAEREEQARIKVENDKMKKEIAKAEAEKKSLEDARIKADAERIKAEASLVEERKKTVEVEAKLEAKSTTDIECPLCHGTFNPNGL